MLKPHGGVEEGGPRLLYYWMRVSSVCLCVCAVVVLFVNVNLLFECA